MIVERTLARRVWILALLALSLYATALSAQETGPETGPAPEPTRRYGERVSIFGDDIHIPANMTQEGLVVSVGADVFVEGHVRDNVVVILGNLRMTGSTDQSVVSILSDSELDGAHVGDQLINILGRLSRSGETTVDGQYVNIGFGNWLPNLPSPFGMLGFFIFWLRLLKLTLMFLVLLLLAVLVPERIQVIAEVAPLRYGVAFFYGLLGYLGMLVIMVLLFATLIGLPIGILLFVFLKLLGIAGVFLAFGRRLGRSLGREMSLLGAILLVFAPFALIWLVPAFLGPWGLLLTVFIGFCVWVFLEVPALGLVMLTRAGTRGPRGTLAMSVAGSPAPPPAAAGAPPATPASDSGASSDTQPPTANPTS